MIPQDGSFEELILKAVSETVESMAFEEAVMESITQVIPDPTTDMVEEIARFEKQVLEGESPEKSQDSSEILWGFLSVLTPQIGDYALWMPKELMRELAAALQCVSPEEIGDKMVLDNFGELLNVLSGRLMAGRLVGNRTFMLDLPQIGSGKIPRLPFPNRIIKFLVGKHYLFIAVPEAFWNPEVWK